MAATFRRPGGTRRRIEHRATVRTRDKAGFDRRAALSARPWCKSIGFFGQIDNDNLQLVFQRSWGSQALRFAIGRQRTSEIACLLARDGARLQPSKQVRLGRSREG